MGSGPGGMRVEVLTNEMEWWSSEHPISTVSTVAHKNTILIYT